MRRLRVSEKAESELVEIGAGLSAFSQKSAQRPYDAVAAKYDDLLEFPFMGPGCGRIKAGWRFFSVDRTNLLLYRVTDETVDIPHVVHGMRNLVKLFSEELNSSPASQKQQPLSFQAYGEAAVAYVDDCLPHPVRQSAFDAAADRSYRIVRRFTLGRSIQIVCPTHRG